MIQKPQKTERIHSLDSLRAIMMLLGLVLHSALTYNVTPHGDAWSLKDPETTHIFSDAIVFLIHSFRMPIFFMVAGFFGSMLFYERQPLPMIKNRVSRILYPFVVFLFALWPLTIFAFGYTEAVFAHLQNPLEIALRPFSSYSAFLPRTTSHLWFLYYLTYTTLTAVLLGLLLKRTKGATRTITKTFDWVIQRPLVRVLFFTGMTFFLLTFLKTSMVDASVSLIFDFNTFTYYLSFYLVGWILFKSKKHLDSLVKYDWIYIIIGLVFLIMQGITIQNSNLAPNTNTTILIFYSSFVVCLFAFGITGLFIRFRSKHSTRMRYISDSSYWVYLIHLPLTAIFPAFIWKLPVPAAIKFLIVLFLTTAICFLSYHYLVRNTFIGQFLNGRKYPLDKALKSVNLDEIPSKE